MKNSELARKLKISYCELVLLLKGNYDTLRKDFDYSEDDIIEVTRKIIKMTKVAK